MENVLISKAKCQTKKKLLQHQLLAHMSQGHSGRAGVCCVCVCVAVDGHQGAANGTRASSDTSLAL